MKILETILKAIWKRLSDEAKVRFLLNNVADNLDITDCFDLYTESEQNTFIECTIDNMDAEYLDELLNPQQEEYFQKNYGQYIND